MGRIDLGFVATGVRTAATAANYARTGVNGSTWTETNEGTRTSWRPIAYGNNGTFVALTPHTGIQAAIAHTSPDGVTWTRHTGIPDHEWWGICWGGGQFVAVAADSLNAMTSPDGATWTNHTCSANPLAVCYGNALYVAVGQDTRSSGRVATSPDGATWTNRASPIALWRSVCYGNGTYVAVGSGGTSGAMTSTDGTTWTARTTPNENWWSVCYDDTIGLFVAVALGSISTYNIMTSPDGVTWTGRGSTSPSFTSVASNGSRYVAVGGGGTYGYSTDGTTWTTGTDGSYAWNGIAHGWVETFGGGIYVDGAVHF